MKVIPSILFLILFIPRGYSQNIFEKDSLTIIADSLQKEGEYELAISVRKRAINVQKEASIDYQAYLKAKYFHSNSANFEQKSYDYHNPNKAITKKAREQYLDSALQSAIKARDLYINIKKPDRKFQYDIQNRIYHQTAYLGNWKEALYQAQLGYGFLKDTLSQSDKTFVDLIYDIGFIYSKLGDYSKSVENYQYSLDLYKTIIGENHTDVAQAYNNIAVEYRNLGLHKKELESLLKAKTIWEQLNSNDDKQFLYRCYGNLFFWYSYYGDFAKAEEYILKKKNLRDEELVKKAGFIRNNEEIYEDQLSEWYDLMLHYSRKKDTIKTIYYAENIIKVIPLNKKLLRFEASILSSSLRFYATLLKEINNQKALELYNNSIKIQDSYKAIYYTNSFSTKLDKAQLLIDSKQFFEAETLLDSLKHSYESQEISHRFRYAILKAKTNQLLKIPSEAETFFNQAFLLLTHRNVGIENATVNDLKPLISFETIHGFLDMGDFYQEVFIKTRDKNDIKKAMHRYLLASEIYNKLYLGERYNNQLFSINAAINTRLLKAYFQMPQDKDLLKSIMNTIENNGSKLTWSKFVFNNQRQKIKLPENLINKEESIKAQLNFYQNALLNSKEDSTEKIDLWKNKIYELTSLFNAIQDSIKEQHKAYYKFNVQDFDIANLQKSLKDDEVIIKYLMTDENLYSFLISKDAIKLIPGIDKAKVLSALKVCLNGLKQRSSNYQESFNEMKTLLLNQVDYQDYKKLTIIPDGALHYFPFEALILDNHMPLISYGSSLLLYQEQKGANSMVENLKIAAFSASNSNSKLPKVSDEITSILKIFDGKVFLNATKTEFLEHANEFNVLHLAMHSNIDEDNPEFSSLNFYGQESNKLYISELYNETYKADMAVLSACDTGNGFYENGEGVISLSRAFNYAGVPSTVMSLWKVDDAATAKIMTYFYQHLSKGEPKDAALKNAKLDYLKYTDDDLLKHPYYWSGFVLTGNTEALIETHNYWVYVSILPFIAIGFFRKRLFQFFKK